MVQLLVPVSCTCCTLCTRMSPTRGQALCWARRRHSCDHAKQGSTWHSSNRTGEVTEVPRCRQGCNQRGSEWVASQECQMLKSILAPRHDCVHTCTNGPKGMARNAGPERPWTSKGAMKLPPSKNHTKQPVSKQMHSVYRGLAWKNKTLSETLRGTGLQNRLAV